ncbi:HEPN domain-containing protein [bacterium]|nr:HEPN domain-containing protein [bacterium]
MGIVPVKEIHSLLKVVKSDAATAKKLIGVDDTWAFNIAYNAALQASLALMYAKGFRPKGEAKHVSVILFLREALDKKYQQYINRLDRMRKKRHLAVYGTSRTITQYEAVESIKFALNFSKELEEMVNGLLL